MIKNFTKSILILFIAFLSMIITAGFIYGISDKHVLKNKLLVFAEDDEREDENNGEDDRREEDEEEDDDDDDDKYQVETQEIVETQPTQPTPIVKEIVIVDPDFVADTDQDGLVNAIDPDPNVPQSEYFNDDDKDGVANAFDQHKGEDDFKYISFEDTNNNGIVDSFENQ